MPGNAGKGRGRGRGRKDSESDAATADAENTDTFGTRRDEGEHFVHVQNWTEAINSFSKALELKENDPTCLVARAKCYLLNGEAAKALADANLALDQDKEGKDIKALCMKAEALYKMGDFETALVFYHRGNKLRPELSEFRLGIQKCQEAIENSIGTPDAIKLETKGDLSFFYKQEERKQQQRSYGKPAMQRKEEKKERSKPQNFSDAKTTKELLGRLFEDKEYLEKLCDAMTTSENTFIKERAYDGLEYLSTRADFWRQQNPMYARKRDKERQLQKLQRTNTASGLDPMEYIIKKLEEIDNAQADGKHDVCLSKSKKTLDKVEKWTDDQVTNRPQVIANLHSCMGNACLELDQLEEALHHHQQDLDIGREHDIEEAKSRAMDNLGRTYARMGRYDKAVEIWEEKVPLSKSVIEGTWLYHEIGRCYLEMNQFADARDYGEKSLAAAQECDDESWQLHATVLIAQAEVKLGELQAAAETFERAHGLAQAQDDQPAMAAIKKALEDVNKQIVQGADADDHSTSDPTENAYEDDFEESKEEEPRSPVVDLEQWAITANDESKDRENTDNEDTEGKDPRAKEDKDRSEERSDAARNEDKQEPQQRGPSPTVDGSEGGKDPSSHEAPGRKDAGSRDGDGKKNATGRQEAGDATGAGDGKKQATRTDGKAAQKASSRRNKEAEKKPANTAASNSKNKGQSDKSSTKKSTQKAPAEKRKGEKDKKEEDGKKITKESTEKGGESDKDNQTKGEEAEKAKTDAEGDKEGSAVEKTEETVVETSDEGKNDKEDREKKKSSGSDAEQSKKKVTVREREREQAKKDAKTGRKATERKTSKSPAKKQNAQAKSDSSRKVSNSQTASDSKKSSSKKNTSDGRKVSDGKNASNTGTSGKKHSDESANSTDAGKKDAEAEKQTTSGDGQEASKREGDGSAGDGDHAAIADKGDNSKEAKPGDKQEQVEDEDEDKDEPKLEFKEQIPTLNRRKKRLAISEPHPKKKRKKTRTRRRRGRRRIKPRTRTEAKTHPRALWDGPRRPADREDRGLPHARQVPWAAELALPLPPSHAAV